MDMYMYYGASTPINTLGESTTTTAQDNKTNRPGCVSIIGNECGRRSQQRPKSRRIATSNSATEIDWKLSTGLKESPFVRVHSKSFHQINDQRSAIGGGNNNNNNQSSTVNNPVLENGKRIWRASKRWFVKPSSSSSATSSGGVATMTNDLNSGGGDEPATVASPSRLNRTFDNADGEKFDSAKRSEPAGSPFRSLPNATKKLRHAAQTLRDKWLRSQSSAAASSSSSGRQNRNESLARKGANLKMQNGDSSGGNQGNKSSDCGKRRIGTQDDHVDRIAECFKDLTVALRFLENVIRKDKLLMLEGSASVILDTVLKLLLILNDGQALRNASAGDSNLQDYTIVYRNLADLIKMADFLATKTSAPSSAERHTIIELCQALRNSVQPLIGQNAGRWTDGPSNGLARKGSLVSSSSASSSAADWAAEDEGESRLQLLEDSLNNNNNNGGVGNRPNNVRLSAIPSSRPVSAISSSSSGCSSSKAKSSDGSVRPPVGSPSGSQSPPGSDSGIFSMNETNVSNESSLTNEPVGGGMLDEVLAKLQLVGLPIVLQHDFHDQQSQQNDDVQTVTEEVEEMVGDTKIVRKKIVTTKKTRHQAVVTTTRQALLESPNGASWSGLSTPEQLPAGSPLTNGQHEFKIVERNDVRCVGSAQQLLPPIPPKKPTLINGTRQRQETLLQQSNSVQSFSRQMLVNGRLVCAETGEKIGSSELKASKSETFDANDRLLQQTGDGSYDQTDHLRTACRILSPDIDESVVQRPRIPANCDGNDRHPPPIPPKRNVVSTYVQVFGSGTPSNQADFRSCTLATYTHLRDRWDDHLEVRRRKAMTFQFASVAQPNNAPDVQQPAPQTPSKPQPVPDDDLTPNGSRDEEPIWVPRKQQDYQNLVSILELNDYLKFPRQPAIKASLPKEPLPFRPTLAVTDVNLLDEIDVKRFLVLKKNEGDANEIRGGPGDALIVHATKATTGTAAHGSDFYYQEAFLTTYRTFISPLELIKKLASRYHKFSIEQDNSKRKAAKNTFALLVRVADDLSPVELNDELMQLLNDFIFRMINDGELNLSRLIRQKLMERYKLKQQRVFEDSRPLYAIGSPQTKATSVLEFKASTLAEQFTFLDWHYFQKIELSEMLLWAQEQSEERSPNLANFTEHFNKMSYWVRTRILEQPDQKEREKVFTKFIKIMRHLRRWGNFNSCLALLSALDSGPIRRLEWPKAISDALNEHACLIDSSQSFKNYRTALAEAKPPCLPYIGLILQDLTFVHIGNANCLPENQCQGRQQVLNFAKRWQQYTILDNMRRFKAWPYNIKKADNVLAFLDNFNKYLSEDTLWEISEKLKPRNQHYQNGSGARRIVVDR